MELGQDDDATESERATGLEAMGPVAGRRLCWTLSLNLVAFGAHLCACGCFVYLPPLLRRAEFSEQARAAVLGLGPLLCVLGVPLVGSWSDACTSRLGRRRPFLLGIGALLALSLAGVAYGESLRNVMGANAHRAILATSTVLLDFASQALLNPCQALVCDLVPDVDFGFAVYSFALSLGGVLGYLLSGLDWTNTALGQAGQERAVFLLLLSVFTACLALNLLVAGEKPAARTDEYVVLSQANDHDVLVERPMDRLLVVGACDANGGLCSTPEVPVRKKSQESPGRHPNGLVQHLRKTHWHKMSTKDVVRTALSAALLFVCNAFCNVFITFPSWLASCLRLDVLTSVPGPLRTLFVFQLLAWMAVMSHYVYFTDFTGEVLFHGRPEQTASPADKLLYDRGVRAGSWGLLVHCVASSVYSLCFQWRLTARLGQRVGLYTAMGSFALALPGLLLFTNVGALLTLSAVTGLASAALDSIPYVLACFYCANKQDYFQGAKHQPGVGQCLAVLDTAEYLAQVLLSMFMGYTIYATGTVASYVCVSTLCAVAACYACSRVACPPRTKNVELYP
ncbi:hypothetical protein HPB47_012141 [Ixodes persulcatus]|uniref:Uncharacterized protein n=1 Tax=Ixodes persulcatus TaxID=34615 RepID=A0AC60NUG3_IXOPE|nr:hypothetical protein HPB47_012141 [Ixodes persulcatus]